MIDLFSYPEMVLLSNVIEVKLERGELSICYSTKLWKLNHIICSKNLYFSSKTEVHSLQGKVSHDKQKFSMKWPI